LLPLPCFVVRQLVEQMDFQSREREDVRRNGQGAVHHSQPENLQHRTQKTVSNLAGRSAVLNLDSSALQPDFRIL
jgi:hypothetical protein